MEIKGINEIFIPHAVAPTIQPIVSSGSFYENAELLANNKFQKYILEGKYKEKWGDALPD